MNIKEYVGVCSGWSPTCYQEALPCSDLPVQTLTSINVTSCVFSSWKQLLPASVHFTEVLVPTTPGPFSGAGDGPGALMRILKVDTKRCLLPSLFMSVSGNQQMKKELQSHASNWLSNFLSLSLWCWPLWLAHYLFHKINKPLCVPLTLC